MAKDDRPPGRIGEGNYISEVIANLIFIGRACAGCLAPSFGGVPCFCLDELTGVLAEAHSRVRWCSEECLHETHEEPSWPDLGALDISVK